MPAMCLTPVESDAMNRIWECWAHQNGVAPDSILTASASKGQRPMCPHPHPAACNPNSKVPQRR